MKVLIRDGGKKGYLVADEKFLGDLSGERVATVPDDIPSGRYDHDEIHDILSKYEDGLLSNIKLISDAQANVEKHSREDAH